MFTLVLGKPGSGKTAMLTWLSALACQAGCLVASNIEYTEKWPFHGKFLPIGTPEYPVFELCEPGTPGAVTERVGRDVVTYRAWWHYLGPGQPWKVFITEIDNYFDASDFANIPPGVRGYFKMHRKWKHDVFADCQVLEHLWTRIRRMAQKYIVCEYTGRSERITRWLPQRYHRFIRSEFASADLTMASHMGSGVMTYEQMKPVFEWYNTDQLVGMTSF